MNVVHANKQIKENILTTFADEAKDELLAEWKSKEDYMCILQDILI